LWGPGRRGDNPSRRSIGINEAATNTTIVGWDDGGAGGAFGHLDGSGNFVAGAPITHYRASLTPGVVHLRAQLDEIPTITDPVTQQPVTTFDENPWWTTGTPYQSPENGWITVWDFTVTDGAAGWLPALDDELSFTASIEPGAAHHGQSMVEHITFPLVTSAHGGYCSNATRAHTPAQPKDTVGNDLKFFDQAGFNINAERTTATTVDEVLAATVKVYGLDYGAHGFLCPHTTVAGSMANARNVARSDPANTVWRYGAGIPIDEDSTTISDDGQNSATGEPWDGNPQDDEDPFPPALSLGDGFPRFDEYRCFKVRGALERADPTVKHLFIINPLGNRVGNTGIWGFETHLINEDEHAGKIVNFYGASNQMAILITETNEYIEGNPLSMGKTGLICCPNHPDQGITISLLSCALAGADPNEIIAHEVGHDLGVSHSRFWDPPSLMNATWPYPMNLNDKDRNYRKLHD